MKRTKGSLAGRIKALWQRLPRSLRYIIPGLLIGFVLLLEIYSRSAAWLFNKAMADQELLRGTITAERIVASPTGHVLFEGLEWKDLEGRRILYIPDGSFTVDIFDTLTQRFSATTIEKLELNNASLSVRLNDDMSVDFVRAPSPQEKPKEKEKLKARDEDKTEEQILAEGEEKRRVQRERIEQDWKNFDRSDQRLDLSIALNDCHLEVFYRQRHYLLEAVRFRAKVDTNSKMEIQLATGPFGGTMIGSGMFLNGNIYFNKKVPTCDLSLLVDAVDPSSLGFGMDVHEPLSMAVRMEGEIIHPVGRGSLHFDRLRIPALDFQNVDGDLYYENAMFRFTDVNAQVYGGTLAAEGWYHLDTRYYHIAGKGQKLKARKALPDAGVRCLVELDIVIDCKGSVQKTSYSGSFVSGRGRYRWMPFTSISGRFHDVGRDLDFYDVKIEFGDIKAETDVICISNGVLQMEPIRLSDQKGNPLMTYDPTTKTLIDTREQGNGGQ